MSLDPTIQIPESPVPKSLSSPVLTTPNGEPINAYELRERISKLDILIKAAHPVMPVMLKQIHDQLATDPEVVTVLTDDEIGIIVTGLKRKMNVEIMTTPAKKETTKVLKSKANNIDMF